MGTDDKEEYQFLRRFKGTAKLSVSDKRLHEIREEVANKYAKNLGIKLD